MSKLSSFQSQYPDAEIRGGMILAIQHAMGKVAAPYFKQAGFENIQPDAWYSMAKYLQVIYDIVEHEQSIMSSLVAMGMETAEHAVLPPDIDTLEKGLMAMQQGWQMNSRNAQEVIWAVQRMDDSTIICTNYSPFPADQEYGVLYAFARRFANGRPFTLAYENLADRDVDDRTEIRFVVRIQ